MSTHQVPELLRQPAKNRRSTMRLLRRLPCHIAESAELPLKKGSTNSSSITGFTHDISSQGLGLVIPSIDPTSLKRIEQEDLLRITFKSPTGPLEVHARPVRAGSHFDGEGTTYLLAARILAIGNPELYQQILDGDDLDVDFSMTGVHKIFEAQVKRTPHQIAVVLGNEQLTFDQVNRRANQLAHLLRQKGVGPEVLVGIFMQRSLEMVIGVLAVLKAGGAYVPMDPCYPGERISFMLEDTRLSIVLTQQSLLKKLPSQLAQVIHVDMEEKEIREEDSADLDCEVEPENLAYVIYTSGSTGQPKGVAMPHRALTNLLGWQLREAQGSGALRTLQFASLSFDVSFQEIFSTWGSGGTLVMVTEEMRRDAPALLRFIVEQGIERCFFPFVYLQHLALVFQSGGVVPQRLREVITAGEQLEITPQVANFFERLPECHLHNQYGPSESHVVTAYTLPRNVSDWKRLPPIGKPIDNTQIYIVNRNGESVPIGDAGELCIGGASLARGYVNRADSTAEKFIPDRFSADGEGRLYRTGDLARYRADGEIEFLGRIDNQIKIRGFRVELGEIEITLLSHPQVREAVVVAQEETKGERKLIAYVVTSGEDKELGRELRTFLKQRLPEYMVPARFVMLDALPLTPSGKINRRALPSPSNQRPPLAQAYVEPKTSIESQLKGMWEELLNIQPIGVRDCFFELGGDSLLATQLLLKIQEVFDSAIPPSALIEEATIEYLARIISTPTDGREYSSLVKMQPTGTKPPIFFVHPLGGEVLGYRALARNLGDDQPFYGLRARGLDGQLEPYTDLPSMAAGYIAEILNVQRQGPFLLGGYSSGGIIAFEIAQQLQAQGHGVAFLAILDEEAPRAAHRSWDPGFVIRFMGDLPYWFVDHVIKRPITEVVADIQRHLKRIAKTIIRTVLKSRAPAFQIEVHDEVDLRHLSGPSLRVVEATYHALINYEPRTYQGRITLYRNRAEALFRSHTTDKGWGKLTSGGVDVIFVPGDHQTLHEEPYAASLAREFERALERCGNGIIRRSRETDLCILFTSSVLGSVPDILM
jgi:amino acid adenylation domain-containing protein